MGVLVELVKGLSNDMRILQKICFVLLLTTFSSVYGAQWSDDKICNDLLSFEKEYNSKLPMFVDEITEVIQVKTNCDTKVVQYIKVLHYDTKKFSDGVMERKMRQHHQLHCNKSGLSSVVNWTAVDTMLNEDMSHFITLITAPKDCH